MWSESLKRRREYRVSLNLFFVWVNWIEMKYYHASKRRNHLEIIGHQWQLFIKKLKKRALATLHICRKMLYNSSRKIRGFWVHISIFHESGKYLFLLGRKIFFVFHHFISNIITLGHANFSLFSSLCLIGRRKLNNPVGKKASFLLITFNFLYMTKV